VTIAKIDAATQQFLWELPPIINVREEVTSLTVDASDNVYAIGALPDELDFVLKLNRQVPESRAIVLLSIAVLSLTLWRSSGRKSAA
jgi:hypothetical protein